MRAKIRQYSFFLPEVVALLAALLGSVTLFSNDIFGGLFSMIVNIGLDPLRSQMVTALMMTAGGALIGAVVGRRKLGAVSGAGIVFCFGYLLSFIQLELQPARDPGGNLEQLNGGALLHTSLVMLALTVLCAFIGAAVGVALGEVLLDPPFQLAWNAWQRSKSMHSSNTPAFLPNEEKDYRTASYRTVGGGIGSWIGVFAVVVSLVLALGSGDLFVYSPDIGLHTPLPIHNKSGISVHSTLVEDSVTSPALGGQKRSFRVYLPPSYYTPQGRTKRYPTLYLLHGAPGSDHDWFSGGKADQSADILIDLGKIPQLILILSDGNGRPGQTSEWGNSFDHRQNIETFVAVDLVKYVDAKYRTIAQAAYRGIGGNSMGGFGATNIAIHHPDVFGFVIALGGYYRAEGSIWGKNAAYIRANSPIDVLPADRRAWRLRMYIGVATRDQPYYNDGKQFAMELHRLHISYQLDAQNGYHSWHVWQVQLYNALTWLHWGN